jgi:predicted Zn-dependent protease
MKYSIIIDDKLKVNKNLIINKIINVLNDKRGVKKLGYNLEYIPNKKNNIDFIIYMVTNDEIIKKCNFSGLSCAIPSQKVIYLNLTNWKKGSYKSKLTLDDYRNYVVTHEVLHIFGRDHHKPKYKGSKAPVMMQQTLGIGDCKPNCWPLYWE